MHKDLFCISMQLADEAQKNTAVSGPALPRVNPKRKIEISEVRLIKMNRAATKTPFMKVMFVLEVQHTRLSISLNSPFHHLSSPNI